MCKPELKKGRLKKKPAVRCQEIPIFIAYYHRSTQQCIRYTKFKAEGIIGGEIGFAQSKGKNSS
jgi:hypothetical protein